MINSLKKIYFILCVTSLIGCSKSESQKDLEFVMHVSESLSRTIVEDNDLNKELNVLVRDSSGLRILVQNTIDTLHLLEESLIEYIGGYQPNNLLNDRRFLLNTEVPNAASVIRNNSFNITTTWINRTSTFLKNNDVKAFPTVIDPKDDPFYQANEAYQGIDYYDIAFEGKNIYQIIIVLNSIKLHVIQMERQFYQVKLESYQR